jgi:hypothetical protein
MTMFDPDISKGTRILQAVGAFLVMAIFTGVIIFTSSGWNNASRDAREAQDDYHAQVSKTEVLQDEYNKLYKEYQAATGKNPKAASPQAVQGESGPAGKNGSPGPKGDMGVAGQTGPAGSPGAQGLPGANGKDGATGASGAAGTNGKDGATGPQGPAGDPGAQGPAGPQGPPGDTGATGPAGPGRGIDNIQCDGVDATSSWIITYTDGSTQQLAGPCRVSVLP